MTSSNGTVLVTGAARRIGKAIALDLAAHGYSIAVHANSSGEEAEAVAGRIRDAGGSANVFLADLTEMRAVRALHGQVSERMGPPDIIVNNASVFEADDVRTFDEDLFDRHFAVHVKAPSVLAEAMAAGLPQDGEGLIVNIIDQRVWKLTPRFFLHAVKGSALDRDTDHGAGPGAAHPCQCHRPGTDARQRAAEEQRFRQAGRRCPA
jgi:NAD(P)-dependent dehydrogenase (short-subunit alcohol dehydrogenase family)